MSSPSPSSAPSVARVVGRLLATPWNLGLDLWSTVDPEATFRPTTPKPGFRELMWETAHVGVFSLSRGPWWRLDALETAAKIRAFAFFHRPCAPSDDGMSSWDAMWQREAAGLQGLAPGAVPDVVQGSGHGLQVAREIVLDEPSGGWVEAFVRRVDESLPAGRRAAALENLGLALRTLRPELLPHAAEQAGRHGFEAELWHGVGRGFYFLPSHLGVSLGPSWPVLDRLLAEVPEGGRAHAVSGLVWALTLVNLRRPEVVGRRLRSLVARAGTGVDAAPLLNWAAHGVAAALMIRRTASLATTATLAASAAGGQAGSKDGERIEALWTALPDAVTAPARRRLHELYPRLVAEDRLAELFRYRPFEPSEPSAPEGSAP